GEPKADELYGGRGTDTYRAGAGDTIIDEYGEGKAKGRVYFDNTLLFGGVKKPGQSNWFSQDNKFAYTLEGTTLTVEGSSGTLTIKDYHKDKKDLNIELTDEPGPTLTLTDEEDTALGEFVDDGNVTHNFAAYDGVEGLDGKDTISADDNHPGFVIQGGDGDDYLYGDTLESKIYTWAEEDGAPLPSLPDPTEDGVFIYGEADKDFIQGSFRADLLGGGTGSDRIWGLFGNDDIIGGDGGDRLYGGGGI
ncbi:MAG: hypothetical protein GY731_07735, partial [Gammaproteobacteria bacterium]|nr:hypothetical protein [Gammaproteobacteria bacterium]